MEKRMSKVNSVLNAFKSGDQLTAKQISSRFGLKNAHDAVYQLRSEGYPIYRNNVVNKKGYELTKYRLGKPSRQMVAAAFAVLGQEAFA
jgi:biotin operon repressor